jgi:hypothetical protein
MAFNHSDTDRIAVEPTPQKTTRANKKNVLKDAHATNHN